MAGLALFHSTTPTETWRAQQVSSSCNSFCPSLSRRRRSGMSCSCSITTFVEGTLGCLYAFLQPYQGAAWGRHTTTTIAKSWRNPVEALRGLKCDTWSSGRISLGYHRGSESRYINSEVYGRRRRSTNGTRLSTPLVAESKNNGKMGESDAYYPPSLPTPGKSDASVPMTESSAAGLNGIEASVDFGLHVSSKVNHRPPLPKNDTTDSGDRASGNSGRGSTATTAVAAPTLPVNNNKYGHVDRSPVDDRLAVQLRISHDDGHRLQSGSREKPPPPPRPPRKTRKDEDSAADLEMRQLGKMRRWRAALEVLASIPAPSERLYLAAISACDWSGEPGQALRVHGLMVAAGIAPSPESLLPIVRGLLFSGDASKALRVFQQSGVRLRVRACGKTPGRELLHGGSAMRRLYATVIRAAHKAGNWRDAVLFYREAELLDPGPAAETARTVFLACYAAKQYAAAATFASDALQPPWGDVARRRMMMNKIIVASGRAGPDHYGQALETYDELERTVGADGYTLTAAIDVLRRLGDWRRALPLLDRLIELGVRPDRGLRTSINAVLSAMGPDDYREALRLAERAAEEWGVEGDVVMYGTLLLSASEQLPPLEGLSPSGEGGEGRREGETVRILRLAVAANAVPSESCLNMVMFGLARSGLWEEALAFVGVVEQAEKRVSRNQREALVAALCVGERWLEAVSAVETMLEEATVVDNATAGLAMKAFANMGLRDHWRAALALMKRAQEASEESMSQDAIGASSWRCLLSGLAREGLHREAAFVVREMVDAGIRMDENSGAALIVAAYATGDYGGALAWMNRLRGAGLPISRNGYAAVVESCCALGKPEAAIRVLESIAEGEAGVCAPGVSAYNAVLEALCRCGRPDMAFDDSSSRAWESQNEESGAFSGVGRSRGVHACGGVNGLGDGVGGVDGVGDGKRRGGGDAGSGEEGRRGRYPSAVERAESAVRLLADMANRGMSANGVTYELVISVLLEAERVDDVVDLWKQAWGEPGLAPLRRDIAHRVLGMCKDKGRGILAVKLLQIGVRLAGREDASWAGPGLFRAAIEACEREGTEAWSAALVLLELWDTSGIKKSKDLIQAVASVVDEAAAGGVAGAIEASATLARRRGGMPPAMSAKRSLVKRAAATASGEDAVNTVGTAESDAPDLRE